MIRPTMLCISALNLASKRSIVSFIVITRARPFLCLKKNIAKYTRDATPMKATIVVKIALMSIASRMVLGSRYDDEFESAMIDARYILSSESNVCG